MRNPAAGGGAAKTTPCCSKVGVKKGPWTPEEDEILSSYINREGEGAWRTLPKRAGLLRCGKSCRLRWMNYLRPHLNRSPISPDEEDLILRLHRLLGNRWSLIAGRIPGRTDNEIKNYWNTHLSKKLISQGLDPRTHKPLEIYNPSPTNHTNHQDPNPNLNLATSSSMPSPRPPPVILGQRQERNEEENAKAKASDGKMMMMEDNYDEDMYFSSLLDSLIMSDERLVRSDDTSQQVLFQDMIMTMQQMGTYDPNQGLTWGAENPPLMASGGFSHLPRDVHNRNLDPAEMGRK